MYSNRNFALATWKRPYGDIYGLKLGQVGRKRVCCWIAAPEEVQFLRIGDNEDISVKRSPSGCAKLAFKSDRDRKEAFLLLSSKKAYEKKGSGRIYTLAWKHPEIVAKGLGASGSAGNIGCWPEYLIRAKAGDAFIVRWSGYGYGIPPSVYFVDRKLTVHEAEMPEVGNLFDSLGIEPPFTIRNQDGIISVEEREWRTI